MLRTLLFFHSENMVKKQTSRLENRSAPSVHPNPKESGWNPMRSHGQRTRKDVCIGGLHEHPEPRNGIDQMENP